MTAGDKIDSITVVVQVNTGTEGSPTWTTVGGQKNATLTRTVRTEDTTTKDVTSRYATAIVGYKEWSVSCGALKVESDTGYAALEAAFNNNTKVQLRWTKASTGVFTGYGWSTDIKETSSEKGPVTLDISFQGDGPITTA
jgi:predicted secreted protein